MQSRSVPRGACCSACLFAEAATGVCETVSFSVIRKIWDAPARATRGSMFGENGAGVSRSLTATASSGPICLRSRGRRPVGASVDLKPAQQQVKLGAILCNSEPAEPWSPRWHNYPGRNPLGQLTVCAGSRQSTRAPEVALLHKAASERWKLGNKGRLLLLALGREVSRVCSPPRSRAWAGGVRTVPMLPAPRRMIAARHA